MLLIWQSISLLPVASFSHAFSVDLFVYLLKYFLFPLVLHLRKERKIFILMIILSSHGVNAEKVLSGLNRTILVALVITLASAAFGMVS